MSSASPAPSRLTDAIDLADSKHAWHPFTQMKEYQANPRLHLVRGEGSWLIDSDGRRYLDGNASVWTNVHGHNDPDLNAALEKQLHQLAHVTLLGLNHPVATELAEELAGLTNGLLPRCFFTDNGSNAVEVALKLSFQFWQLTGRPEKRGVISMSGAYHGDTFGTMSVGDNRTFHKRFSPWLFPSQMFEAPRHEECAGKIKFSDATQSLQALENILKSQASQTASLILEPRVQGAAGMHQQPAGFIKAVAQLCQQYDVHLILDEVFTGFGRLGSLTACTEEGVAPDFLCLAKGLAAGYLPLAATLTSEKIYEAFQGEFSEGRTFFHGHTFSGNPLGCAVALASLKKLRPMISSGQIAERAQQLGDEIQKNFSDHPNIASYRQYGLTGAVDFKPADTSAKSWTVDMRVGYQIALAARRHGLVIRPLGDSILFVPPISIQSSEVTHLVQAVRRAMDDVIPNL
ncbi:MAG: adenosylmethionine--8-amino-7-oxononanoate transaminase [Opitutales bacterium]|nr:adenosylmethionine--8-amino-7-oxononanoate transaminase [Opitutales bacterium]